ncbi:hypothetical protein BDZ88DRAFT_435695 [Geranomyces variabilis]|nr:hypothetical protein BDZ88DRAFT_435695 [Geranomyces variabilis]
MTALTRISGSGYGKGCPAVESFGRLIQLILAVGWCSWRADGAFASYFYEYPFCHNYGGEDPMNKRQMLLHFCQQTCRWLAGNVWSVDIDPDSFEFEFVNQGGNGVGFFTPGSLQNGANEEEDAEESDTWSLEEKRRE